MIYRWLFPSHGGGSIRRYFQFRFDIMKIYGLATDDKDLYYSPVTLFDFTRPIDAADIEQSTNTKYDDGWKMSDDRVIGGFTKSTYHFIQTQEDLYNYYLNQIPSRHNNNEQNNLKRETITGKEDNNDKSKDDDKKDNDSSNEKSNDNSTKKLLPIPFIRWTGILDTQIGLQSNVQRSGFAAIRSPEFTSSFFTSGGDGANLRNMYNALEITCRSIDQRTYTVNLKVSTSIPDDMYQCKINPTKAATTMLSNHTKNDKTKRMIHNIMYLNTLTSSTDNNDSSDEVDNKNDNNNDDTLLLDNVPFQKIVIPFTNFRVTSMGRERYVHRELDDTIKIESIGFVLMDGIDGNFQFDLMKIRAVNVIDEDYYYDAKMTTTTANGTKIYEREILNNQ